MSEREPILMCATGKKGVGKTYTTENSSVKEYIKSNAKSGKEARKVLIYDINMEYTDYKVIDVEDIGKFRKQKKIEVRRVLPIINGRPASLSEMVDILNKIITRFRGGLLLLEDINRYLIQAKTAEVIGLLATNRHRDLDIICHFQSLSALDPRMWQNTTFVRFHYQNDQIDRYRQRIPNYEMFKIAQCLVNFKYLNMGDKRFFCYVAVDDSYITGDFTRQDFHKACVDYLEGNPKRVNDRAKRFGKDLKARNKAMKHLIVELFQKYYRGI